MSRRGNCHDNAVMGGFFSTLKRELGKRFGSHGDAKMGLFDYIEVLHARTTDSCSVTKVSTGSGEAHGRPGGG